MFRFAWVGAICFATAASAESIVCDEIHMLDFDTGKLESAVSEYTIKVYDSPAGLRGLVAEFRSASGVAIEKDVEVSLLPDTNSVRDLASVVAPEISFDDVKSVRAANIGVSANADDANGAFIYELMASDSSVLAKLVQIGWGPGRCGPVPQ